MPTCQACQKVASEGVGIAMVGGHLTGESSRHVNDIGGMYAGTRTTRTYTGFVPFSAWFCSHCIALQVQKRKARFWYSWIAVLVGLGLCVLSSWAAIGWLGLFVVPLGVWGVVANWNKKVTEKDLAGWFGNSISKLAGCGSGGLGCQAYWRAAEFNKQQSRQGTGGTARPASVTATPVSADRFNCGLCGTWNEHIPAAGGVCSSCGARLRGMQCSRCGTRTGLATKSAPGTRVSYKCRGCQAAMTYKS